MQVSKRKRTTVMATATAVVAAVGLAGCGGGGSSSSDSKTVTVWTSVDQPTIDGFNKVLGPEAKKQGITVNIKKVNDIQTLVMTSIQANKSPDIAILPQPGVVADVVKRNKATALDSIVDMAALKKSMTPGTLDAGTINGKLYGLLVSMNVKSLVFYNKKAWATAGYPIPKSLDELNSLTDKIKADGGTPWCMGLQDPGGASGWPMTDWMEDLVMRYGGATKYNDWVTHKIKFDDPVVKQAGAEVQKLLFTSGNVTGGQKAIANSNWQTVANSMFDTKPGCWMIKQGNFITGFFPKAVQKNLDANVGVFGFPPASAGGDDPTLGGGDLATLLNDNKSSEAVMKLMADKNLGNGPAKLGGYISPHKDFDLSLYPNTIVKGAAQVAYGSTQFLFDGSDAMPASVGAGSFWKQMVSWTAGEESLDEALKNIDQSWPTS
ncbi:MAG: ABC transporter substrate-binding protein [Nocardioidaceae bacterium]